MITRLPGSLLHLILLSTCLDGALGAGAVAPIETTSAADVRRLPPEAAAEHHPVRLRGNLLLVTTPRNAVVIFDGTEGIYVELDRPAGDGYRLGDLLEVEGVTDAGDFAPIVRASRVARVGAGELPAPRPTTIAELNAGGFDAAWIELRGIVRNCVRTPPDRMPVARSGVPAGPPQESSVITLAQGDDKMELLINARVDPHDIVDAEIRVRGVVFNVHNASRQFVRASIQVADRSLFAVVVPPPADPFAVPEQPIREVLRFAPTGFTGHRVHVRGVVTAHKDQHTLWLRDGDRGMRVASAQAGNLAPGDEVEVVGFPDHGSYTPSLSDAVFRKVRAGAPPVPQPLATAGEISQHDANLVQVDAELREVLTTTEGTSLILQWRGLEVTAVLERDGSDAPAKWEPGSTVRVTGICLARSNNFFRPTGLWLANDLQLRLRTAADVTVLKPAPWLTATRALGLVLGLAGLMLVALVTVAVLARRQIAQREEARKLAEVEFSAMLAERNRLAREIHDTLAQNLNAVSMQLELARNSARTGVVDEIMPHLGTAHQIVRTCIREARESIWNMRSHVLERNDLIGALRAVAEQLSAGLDCRIGTRVEGRPRRLAPLVENNLLRIGQEAVANALKHARARHIEVAIFFTDAAIRLMVEDDGAGFESTDAAGPDGRFGLRGMRERVAQMSGHLTVGRGQQGGTRVEVVVDSVG